MSLNKQLNKFTSWFTAKLGRAWATILAILLIVVWLIGLPIMGLSDTYQLVINTTTTIITFIMVFAIQNTQNRDNSAIHIKLDRILQSTKADTSDLYNIESLTDKELEKMQKQAQAKSRKKR